MKLQGSVIPIGQLTLDHRRQMLALMQRHYANVRLAEFEMDLAEKDCIIQLLDPATGRLCGFSTQKVLDSARDGQSIKALFSGDTIIDRQYWGDRALMHAWGNLALALIDEWPDSELYWFLISQGFRTYRFLPIFFREFFPRFDCETPAWARGLIDTLGRQKFLADYCPKSGIVRASTSQYRLRDHLGELTVERLQDPHVRFFADRNPGHAQGDELCCIAPLTRANFTAAAYRMIETASTLAKCS
jgi:hypothetical protein